MALASKILVVDDVAQNVKLLADLLSAKGYVVVKAYSGEEGLLQLATERPDLILLDVMMPEMDGYTAIQEIRKNNQFRNHGDCAGPWDRADEGDRSRRGRFY